MYYTFHVKETKEEVVKHIFGKDTIKTVEVGDTKLYLYFDKDMTEEEYLNWCYICSGLFAMQVVLNQ